MRPSQRIAAAAALLALAAVAARAQDIPVDPPVPPFTNVYVALGTAFSNVDALNARFSAANYDAIAGHGFSVGGGGYVPFGRALFGAEYHDADFGFESTGTGRTNRMDSRYWIGTVGYAIYTTWHFNIIGLLGAGMGTTKITVSDRNGGTPVGTTTDPLFDDILASPGFSSVLTGSYTVFQPALGVDYLMLRTNESHMGVTFGLRFGTTISPHRTSWTYEGRDVVGAPDAGPVGGFLRVSVGIGGFKLIP
ncbi:MAG: hypothetical protein ACHQSE_02305 [Gemmatimonadales bacterium]